MDLPKYIDVLLTAEISVEILLITFLQTMFILTISYMGFQLWFSRCRPTLYFRMLSTSAIRPTRGSLKAAGYDLYSPEDLVVRARDKAVVNLGIAFEIPNGCYGRIASRSGLAAKHSITTEGGVIDADYRGNVGVILYNHSTSENYQINRGERIAQLICEKIVYPDLREKETLSKTCRDGGKMGSTGY